MQSFFAILMLMVSNLAGATGHRTTLYDCRAGQGESAASVKLDLISMSGGPMRQWLEAQVSLSWFGGTHATERTSVRRPPEEGPVEGISYVNEDKNFFLTVWGLDKTVTGTVLRIDVSGQFVSKSGTSFSLSRRWLDCH